MNSTLKVTGCIEGYRVHCKLQDALKVIGCIVGTGLPQNLD